MTKLITFRHRTRLNDENCPGGEDTSFYALWAKREPTQDEADPSKYWEASLPKRAKSVDRDLMLTVGSAIVSSASFASIIKTWLTNRRRKIKITNHKTNISVEYEGTQPIADLAAIESSINGLIGDDKGYVLEVQAKIPEDEIAHPSVDKGWIPRLPR